MTNRPDTDRPSPAVRTPPTPAGAAAARVRDLRARLAEAPAGAVAPDLVDLRMRDYCDREAPHAAVPAASTPMLPEGRRLGVVRTRRDTVAETTVTDTAPRVELVTAPAPDVDALRDAVLDRVAERLGEELLGERETRPGAREALNERIAEKVVSRMLDRLHRR